MIRPEEILRIHLRLHRLQTLVRRGAEEPLTALPPLRKVEVVAPGIPWGESRLDDLDVRPHRCAHLGGHGDPDREHREPGLDRRESAVARLHTTERAAEVSHLDREQW